MTLLAIIFFIGVGDTAIMDLWGWLRKRMFGGKGLDYGLVGRWIAHMPHGCFRHDNIATTPKKPCERLIGWSAHYGIGIAASRTPRPNAARLQSLLTHAVFGLGLYVAAWAALLLFEKA